MSIALWETNIQTHVIGTRWWFLGTARVQFNRGGVVLTRQDEEYPGYEGEDGALWSYVSDVADDEGCEDKQQRDHRERGRRPHHFWTTGEIQKIRNYKTFLNMTIGLELQKEPGLDQNIIYHLRL